MYLSQIDLELVLARAEALRLCRLYGGVEMYLPRAPDTRHPYCGVVGILGLKAMCAAFGGGNVTLPKGNHLPPKKSEILSRLDRGEAPREIALDLQVTERWVRHLAAAGQGHTAGRHCRSAACQLPLFPGTGAPG
ncbi:MAG: RNA helicase [Deltaproteobacteria bacterium]|jgi:Mor family transcriptional regulator|nr:RNA helicase [Deltaproteobacteria bacterium]